MKTEDVEETDAAGAPADAGGGPAESGDDPLRREVIDSWKNRYAGLFLRRWGKSPHEPNARRMLVAHDEAWADHSLERVRRLFGATGARIDHYLLTGSGGSFPRAGDYDVLVIAGVTPPGGDDREPLASFARELLEWSGLVAGIAGGAAFLFNEQLLKGAPPEGEIGIVEGERVFACGKRDGVEELAKIVLDRLAAIRSLKGEVIS